MNTFAKIAVLTAALSLSMGATAGAKTDANYLAECKAGVKAQFESVEKIDVASINSRRHLFKAKLRVKADGERAIVACEIRGDQPLALNCLKGNVCNVKSVASK